MEKNKNRRELKKIFLLILMFAINFAISGAANAEGLANYLAPQYKDIPFNPETALLPATQVKVDKPENEQEFLAKKTYRIKVTNEYEKLETALKIGFAIVPSKNKRALETIKYLKNSPEMMDSAKLRVVARTKKLEFILKSGDLGRGEFYKKMVSAPIVLFADQTFLDEKGLWASSYPTYLIQKDGSRSFFFSFINVGDISGLFSVADSIKNDTFDLVIAHENAHCTMYDMYGTDIEKMDRRSNLGHDGPIVSDRAIAYCEGWAEAFEALYGPANPLLKLKESEREKYRISEFLFTRQDPVRRDSYIWQNYKGRKTGVLKNGAQMLATEGVIAGIFYDILTSKAISDPFGKSLSVMYLYKPMEFVEFINGWAKEYSEDKPVIYRIFLENTNYATVSNEARKLYFDYYQAKLKYVQKQMDEKTFSEFKNKWTSYKETLFCEVMKSNNITANVSPDLWVSVRGLNLLSLQSILARIVNMKGNLNIATLTAEQIKLLEENKIFKEFAEEDVRQFIKAREQMGVMPYKTGTEALRAILGEEKANKLINTNNITDIQNNVQNNEQRAAQDINANTDVNSADKPVENKDVSPEFISDTAVDKSASLSISGQSAQALGIVNEGNFSGSQRSAMSFGNQIENASDSLSVPDTKGENKLAANLIKPEVVFEPCATSAEEFQKDAKLYYVLMNRTDLKNFTDACESSGVTPVICPPSRRIEEMGKVGVIVEPKGNAMALEFIRSNNGRPLKDVVLIVSVLNLDLKTRKIVEAREQIRGDFGKCFDILNKMIKSPFGQRASMFRNIAKHFPGLLEKLPVSEVEANGKIYKQFDSPIVNIQLAAPGMNGTGKHVVLFHDSYVYLFIKYLPKQIRK